MTTAARLEALARGWRRRRLLGMITAGFSAALLAGVVARVVSGASTGAALIASLAVAAVAGVASLAYARRKRVNADTVARYLDRTYPALEDSTELLLADTGSLTRLELIQRERAASVLRSLPPASPPNRPMRLSLSAAGVMFAASAAVAAAAILQGDGALLPTAADAPATVSPRGSGAHAPRIRSVEMTIEPPAYTGRPVRRHRGGDAEVEEGARVEWRLAADQPVTVLLVSASGDTMPFAGGTLALVATRPMVYHLIARGATGLATGTELHQLIVQPDRPPSVAVVAPPPRTLLAAGEPVRVPVRALADDDYGVAGAEIIATVTTGRGETVRFREERIAFGARSGVRARAELRGVIDLAALALEPGDELYFHVRATDTRRPAANEGRSDTYFIALLDTTSVVNAEFAGMPVDRLPEYFRSQRQIIIDTERLIAERPRLTAVQFGERSNAIGVDQGLLRIRYGELVGDETEGGGADETDHMHDTEENATLLAASVKATLKAALAEMWEAEVKLRTHDPAGALPHENRALTHLKEVQQASRVYVQRVGFEPPPLEPDLKRLTGERTGIADRRDSRKLDREDPDAALRAALPLLDGPAGQRLGRGHVVPLEAAGHRLAELAVARPGGDLAALRILRRLIDSVERGVSCAGCADTVAAAIRRALPPAAAAPTRGSERGTGSLARRYFDLLEQPRVAE